MKTYSVKLRFRLHLQTFKKKRNSNRIKRKWSTMIEMVIVNNEWNRVNFTIWQSLFYSSKGFGILNVPQEWQIMMHKKRKFNSRN